MLALGLPVVAFGAILQAKSLRGRRLLNAKWIQFGGGAYGAAALWTLIVLEAQDMIQFATAFPGLGELMALGPGGLLAAFFQNQLDAFIGAITWFLFWASEPPYIPIWIIVAAQSYALSSRLLQHWPRPGPPGAD